MLEAESRPFDGKMTMNRLQSIAHLAALRVTTVIAAVVPHGAIAHEVFIDEVSFLQAAGQVFKDDFESDYAFDEVVSDAEISAVKGVTQFQSTGLSNTNTVQWAASTGPDGEIPIHRYYAYGSFEISFTSPAFNGAGTNAVGFYYANWPDYLSEPLSPPWTPYFAVVKFADSTTATYSLVTTDSFDFAFWYFGITSEIPITSIHLGLADGSPTVLGGFQMDDLSVAVVPEPSPRLMLLLGLLGICTLVAVRNRA